MICINHINGTIMKIAEIVATFPPYHGGMGYCCFHSADQLAKLGHDVTVFTIDHGRLDYNNDPKHFSISRLKSLLMLGDGAVLPQLYSKLKDFDVIHLHYPFYGGAEYVYLACLLNRQKLFLTYHMDVHGDSFFKKIIINLYETLLLKKIIKKADAISSPGNKYLKSTKIGKYVPWKNVVDIVHGGVDIEKFKPRKKNKELIAKHNLEGKTVVLFVGNIQPFKRLDLLIKSVAQINDKNVVLLVVGGGYGESDNKKLAMQLNVSDRVIFTGPQSPDKYLPAYYNLGDFLVLPSTHSESFGLVVLEAMASGIPAIVSSLPGPSQLINEGVDGLIAKKGNLLDLRNKVTTLSLDSELCKKMGKSARQKILEQYSWEMVGKQLEQQIKTIVK